MILGLNLPPDGWSFPPSYVSDLGARAVRLVATPEHDLTGYLHALRTVGAAPLLVIARESLVGSYEETARYYVERYGGLADRWQIGNEADHQSESSWSMRPRDLVRLARAFRAVLTSGAHLVCAGMVSGNPLYLEGVDLSPFHAIAVHPYGQRPDPGWPGHDWGFGYVGDLIPRYRRFGLPVEVTEIGLSSDSVGGAFQAEYLSRMVATLEALGVTATYWFCGHDYHGFGLIRGQFRTPSYAAFATATGALNGAPPPPPLTPAYIVGDGVLAAMAERGDWPVGDETYANPRGGGSALGSITRGQSGAHYVWIRETGRVAVIEP